MKLLFTALFCCFCIPLFAQDDIKIFYESKTNGYILYAGNNAFCPFSVALNLTLDNMKFSKGQQSLFVIPAKTEKFKLGELDMIERGVYNFHYTSRFNYGDVTLSHYDTNYVYDLPYEKGKRFWLYQGYNGTFSHQNQNELDFTMPEGTKILAAREGVVVKVVQNNTRSCPTEECRPFANQIMIYHTDGTLGVYAHLKYNGAAVNIGDVVKKGDLIAYSGNTGFSSGPHLHFACHLPNIENKITVTTKFKIENGTKTDYLQEKVFYLKDY